MSTTGDATQTTPLLAGDAYNPSIEVARPSRSTNGPDDHLLNFQVSRRPWRLFEWCDLAIVPNFIRSRAQAVLTAQWTHKLPFVQEVAPAERAAALIYELIQDVTGDGDSKVSVVDFCSGGGGPIPTIEKLVNNTREQAGLPPVPFVITDLHPPLDAWIKCASESDNLNFVPQSVDATNPPAAVINQGSHVSAQDANEGISRESDFTSGARIIRLYCLAFHHFDDETARKVLSSTLETADGFAILELQDRRLFSLIMMLADLPLVLLASPFWFWKDPLQLIFTHLLPIIPPIMSFDGFVSALRTRTFEEIVILIDETLVERKKAKSASLNVDESIDRLGRLVKTVQRDDWILKGRSEQHTWPLGWMNSVVGVRKAGNAEQRF